MRFSSFHVRSDRALLARAGTAVAIDVPAPDSTVTLDRYPLAEDFTTWLQGAADGRIDLGALVTTVPPSADVAIAEAFRAMLAGEVIRTVISFD